MKNILIISGHTNLNDSVVNKEILTKYKKLFPEAEIVYLDKLYPDFKIDVKVEQEKLVKADIIILQYPIFWYHMPSIMERWMEETFTHGFAYGDGGDKLKGKKLIASLTLGAPLESYHKDANVGYEIEDFLPSLKATCRLTQMDFAGSVHTAGISYQTDDDVKKEKAEEHAKNVDKLIKKI